MGRGAKRPADARRGRDADAHASKPSTPAGQDGAGRKTHHSAARPGSRSVSGAPEKRRPLTGSGRRALVRRVWSRPSGCVRAGDRSRLRSRTARSPRRRSALRSQQRCRRCRRIRRPATRATIRKNAQPSMVLSSPHSKIGSMPTHANNAKPKAEFRSEALLRQQKDSASDVMRAVFCTIAKSPMSRPMHDRELRVAWYVVPRLRS